MIKSTFVVVFKTKIKFLQMLKKTSKLHSILTGTCPRCHQESMYVNKNPYIITKLYQMHEKCASCGLKYKIEPSFFFGAMYVSYGLTIAIGVATYIIASAFLVMNVNEALVAISIGILLLMPVTARLARNIYIHMFVKFKPNWRQEFLRNV